MTNIIEKKKKAFERFFNSLTGPKFNEVALVVSMADGGLYSEPMCFMVKSEPCIGCGDCEGCQ